MNDMQVETRVPLIGGGRRPVHTSTAIIPGAPVVAKVDPEDPNSPGHIVPGPATVMLFVTCSDGTVWSTTIASQNKITPWVRLPSPPPDTAGFSGDPRGLTP